MSAKNIVKSLNKKSELQKALAIVSIMITGLLLISASPALAQDQGKEPQNRRIPEPSSAVGVLAVGALGAGLLLKNKLKRKQ
ncbi:hypothetical protein SAMD00079811_62540 [Scytonema sp. HK-05]|uniref:PEP-CTERM sorting domain-containing protein n=1 Tax=Scytonema sp. HK-05 TaxID=1137095 RepID=UPI000937442D|nr:PEP-CTERM sorting domain-containing protein [Scytonema sp. HK-05]BAY48628.1 hypothetical protein SAMD00079811_62540 [Scytonema sp. HK-05]